VHVRRLRLLILLALVGVAAALWVFDLQHCLQLDVLRERRAQWQAFHRDHRLGSIGLYV
jgi:hypothetical protein